MLTVDIDSNSGFCAGVIRAIGKAEEFLTKDRSNQQGDGKLYSLGAIVHNDAELTRLMDKGLVTIDKDEIWRWVNGYVICNPRVTASKYVIETYEGTEYLFVQWKSGDYSYGGEQPFWYVFKR